MKNVTLRQFRVFSAVAEHLSYSRAARTLHVTQPAVSLQVRALEQAAGIALVEKHGKRLVITEAGRELLRHWRNIAGELKETDETLAALKGLRGGRLTVTVTTTAQYFASRLLAAFLKRHPDVRLQVEVCNRDAVIRHLVNNDVDLAIMGRPPEQLGTAASAFASHPYGFIAAPDHPLAGRLRVPLKVLAREPLIVREQGSGTRAVLDELFAAHGLALDPTMEMNGNEAIRQAVMAGMGVSFLSLPTARLELAANLLATVDVEGSPIMRAWYLVHRADKRLPPAARGFHDFLLGEGSRAIEALMGEPSLKGPPRKRARARR